MYKCHFDDLFIPPADPIEILNSVPYIPLLDGAITEAEIHWEIDNIKAAKAPGVDGVQES